MYDTNNHKCHWNIATCLDMSGVGFGVMKFGDTVTYNLSSKAHLLYFSSPLSPKEGIQSKEGASSCNI